MLAPEHIWSDRLAAELGRLVGGSEKTVVTWVNHHTSVVNSKAGTELSSFDIIGVDGQFLRAIMGKKRIRSRTSADLVLPRLLTGRPGLRVLCIGGSPEKTVYLQQLLQNKYELEICQVFDGFAGRPDPNTFEGSNYDVAIVGLGAPLQDEYALKLARLEFGPTVIATCGGWLDQIVQPKYYPAWAYRYRLNWFLRLVSEPRRLWRRYTFGAVKAARMRRELRDGLSVYGIAHHEHITNTARIAVQNV